METFLLIEAARPAAVFLISIASATITAAFAPPAYAHQRLGAHEPAVECAPAHIPPEREAAPSHAMTKE